MAKILELSAQTVVTAQGELGPKKALATQKPKETKEKK